MITLDQAKTVHEFHAEGGCTKTVGPRGGVTIRQEIWRRNGRTQLWKTRPDEFRVPVKYGLYNYSSATTGNAEAWHTREDCPLGV